MFNKYYPDFYFNKVEDIPISLLENNNIKGVIFDLDNTLINFFSVFSEELLVWFDTLRNHDIKTVILSNSRSSKRVEKIANKFDIEYICDAKKPNLEGFERATTKLNVKKSNIAIIGDQIFTDIVGGKKYGIKTILVKPKSLFEVPEGLIKRPFEIPILISYKKSKKSRKI